MAALLQFYFVLLLLIQLFLSNILATSNLSYSHLANWILKGDPSLCVEKHLCTPSGKSFDLPIVESEEFCSFLASHKVKQINFFGDSYMRHIYIATAMFLTNNYKDASSNKDEPFCKYGHQFTAPKCREIIANPITSSCNGTVKLSLVGQVNNLPSLYFCGDGQLNFWSEGNHPVDLNYTTRVGVNNPVEYQKKFSGSELCKKRNNDSSLKCSLFWISTHARPSKFFLDEEEGKVRFFNEQMRRFFESGQCGAETGYIDVYNMTSNLVHLHYPEAQFMSFDAAHWGMEVNLVKVQILANALKSVGMFATAA